MAEYSRIAKGTVSSLGGATPVILPFQPDAVELYNFTAATTPTVAFVPEAYWDANMGQGAAQYQVFDSTPALITATTATGGITTFNSGLALQYGAAQQVVGITKASPAVVTVTGHGLVTGDVVVFSGLYQSATTGMPQISNIPFVVTVTGANTFTIPWNTNQSGYTALSGSPSGAVMMKVSNPFLFAPGVSYITSITTGTSTTIVTTAPHNMVTGQEVAFRIPTLFGTTQLNSLPNVNIPGSPIYGVVTVVNSSTSVTVNINSSSYTAFNTNIPFASTVGLTPAQMVAVGDYNTGGWPITATSGLYPSPLVNGVRTIGGPAIQGAFLNNSFQGFVIGATVAGASSDVIYYRAYLSDYSNP